MEKQDTRKLSHEELTALRRRTVALVQRGESPENIARVMGASRASVYGWLALCRNDG